MAGRHEDAMMARAAKRSGRSTDWLMVYPWNRLASIFCLMLNYPKILAFILISLNRPSVIDKD